MTVNLTFNESMDFEPGIIFRLLSECYTEILDQQLQVQLQKFDQAVFSNPETVGACTFITTLDSEVIGMASYDPRQAPELGIIGHNCILPEHQRKGYGKQQIQEAISRLKMIRVRRISVSTSEHPFFEPARRMYLSCGFFELAKQRKNPQELYKTVYYEMELE
jgi:GNAT superfamily N-acetyltransferase